MTPQQRTTLLESLTPDAVETIARDWEIWARDNQLAPAGSWFVWLVLAGRGFGKTRTGAEWVLQRVREGARRIALIAPTAADARDTMIEGPAGILACAHSAERPVYEPSKRRLVFPMNANGFRAIATTFAAVEPERLRGPQHDTAWCDELATWRYPETAWSNLVFGLRLGDPRVCVTTTPRPIPTLKDILNDPTTRVTRGSTFDNASNLAARFLAQLKRKHEGTRLGRQELFAELLEDTPGALWTSALLERNRVAIAPELERVVVAIDPQAAEPSDESDEDTAETGIVAGGIDARGHAYVTRDVSGHYSPAEWGERAVMLFDELGADLIVAEKNQGGAMVGHVLKTAAEKLYREKRRKSPVVNFKLVTATRGKDVRAEPVAALDEQGRCHHVGHHAALESQMTTWVRGQKSPDRFDARVWLVTELLVEPDPEPASYRGARNGFRGAVDVDGPAPQRPQRERSRRHDRDDD